MSYLLKKNEKKNLAIFFGLSFIFIYPLLHFGVYFRDDLDRSVTGFYGWSYLGRPLADFVAAFLSSSDNKLLDIFPYNLIICCALLALACLHLKRMLVSYNARCPAFIASLIIFNPFMLQNLAYKYDSVGMTLALLLSVLSYTFSHSNQKISILIKISFGVAALSLYQPCVNFYLGMMSIESALIFSKSKYKFENYLLIMLKKGLVFVTFYAVYFLTIARFYGANNKRSQTISLDSDGYTSILTSFSRLNNLIEQFMHGQVVTYFYLPATLLIIAAIVILAKNKAILFSKSMILICTALIFYISLLGPTILLKNAPVFSRTLVSFPCLLVISTIIYTTYFDKLKFATLLPVITIVSFSSQFANAIHEQREQENMVLNMVTYDLLNLPNIKEIKTFGSINYSERSELIASERPLVNQSLSRASEFLATFQLQNKGLIGVSVGYGIEKKNGLMLEEFIRENIKPIIKNSEYSIYVKNDIAIVVFGNSR